MQLLMSQSTVKVLMSPGQIWLFRPSHTGAGFNALVTVEFGVARQAVKAMKGWCPYMSHCEGHLGPVVCVLLLLRCLRIALKAFSPPRRSEERMGPQP